MPHHMSRHPPLHPKVTNVTSIGQTGGITAGVVNNASAPVPAAPAKANGWQKTSTIVALLGLLAIAATVLTYFGLKPGGP